MLTLLERNELIVNHLSFAETLAYSQFRKMPTCVQVDELKSAAYMGLVDAANKYDGGIPFKAYASFRIIGEIKDYLRTLYWGGRGQKINVSSLSEDMDKTAEEEVSSFDETFEDITKNLSFLNKKILHMYYAQDLSMKEIAAQVDLSPTRVFQLLKISLKKCRESYD